MRRIICLTLFCLSGVDPAQAATPVLIQSWNFHASEDAQGWTAGNQLRDFGIAGNRLCMTVTGSDAYFFSPPINLSLDGCMVRVTMKCDRDGDTQIYWKTKDDPEFDERKVTGVATAASVEFTVFEFTIARPADAGKTLTGIRIDPFNNSENGTVEIESIELLRLPPMVDVHFSLNAHHIDVGESAVPLVTLKQKGGSRQREPFTATWRVEQKPTINISPSTQPAALPDLHFDRPGVHYPRVVLQSGSEKLFGTLDTSVIVGQGERLPLLPAIRTDRIRLDFIPAEWSADHMGAARWQIADRHGVWHEGGWLLPLYELTVERHDGSVARVHAPAQLREYDERSARLEARLYGWDIDVEMEVVEVANLQAVSVTATLKPKSVVDEKLIEFSPPILRVNSSQGRTLDRYALFGGSEFLEPEWPSSSERAVGAKFAERWSPHPFKITLPVMAIEADGVTSALMWQPLDKWSGPHTMPTATFASPNFLDGQDNHLMKLSAPSIPAFKHENEFLARSP